MDPHASTTSIEPLLILQERDQRIARCALELRDIPVKRQAAENGLRRQSEALETAKTRLKAKQADVHTVEVEIESLRQQIAKYREQQFQIKSNEEYKTLNREIAAVQEKIKAAEDREIGVMEAIEQIQAEQTQARNALTKAEGEVRQEQARWDARAAELESEIQRLRQDRERLLTGIESAWLARYQLVMENKRDVALVPVENGAFCGACHMKLPPQVAHDAKKAAAIVSCNFCGRMLYWPPT